MVAVVDLRTCDRAHLDGLKEREFLASLEPMSGPEIARFRRLRKLSGIHNAWLERYLDENPEKRVAAPASPAPKKPAARIEVDTEKLSIWTMLLVFALICAIAGPVGYLLVREFM